jgi:hypothetical protein
MTPPFRLVQPGTQGRTTAPKIHYEAPSTLASLCGQAEVFAVVDGDKMRVWHHTKRLVTCKGCIKAMEIQVRKELAGLNGDQLEDILAHIDTFKNRYGATLR